MLQVEQDHKLGLITHVGTKTSSHNYVPAVLKMLFKLFLNVIGHILKVLQIHFVMQLYSQKLIPKMIHLLYASLQISKHLAWSSSVMSVNVI